MWPSVTNSYSGLRPRIGSSVTQECCGLWPQQTVAASVGKIPYVFKEMVTKSIMPISCSPSAALVRLPLHLKQRKDYHKDIRSCISKVTHLRGPSITYTKRNRFFSTKAKMSKPVKSFLLCCLSNQVGHWPRRRAASAHVSHISLIILIFIKFCRNDFLIEKGKDRSLH